MKQAILIAYVMVLMASCSYVADQAEPTVEQVEQVDPRPIPDPWPTY